MQKERKRESKREEGRQLCWVEEGNEHCHSFNRTQTCTALSSYTQATRNTTAAFNKKLKFILKKGKEKSQQEVLFFLLILLFCAHFHWWLTGGWCHSYGHKRVVSSSIASGWLWRLGSRGAASGRRYMHEWRRELGLDWCVGFFQGLGCQNGWKSLLSVLNPLWSNEPLPDSRTC